MLMQVAALDILTTQGGFAPAAARAIGEAIILQIKQGYEGLATSQQLNELRAATSLQISELRAATGLQISELRAATSLQIGELRAATSLQISELREEIAAVKSEVLRWMFVAMTGQTVVLIGLMRWFLPHDP